MNIYQQILIRYWGYPDFRPVQEDIIKSVAAGHDTLGLLPTGGGKSLTFQVPTLAGDGMCLVITPLIALMKDQVEKLNQKGIRAMALHSGLSRDEIDIGLNNAIYGNFKFLYVSPERLATEIFRVRLPQMNLTLVAIDEAHCISQWGYDFRPSYLKIADLRERLSRMYLSWLSPQRQPERLLMISRRNCSSGRKMYCGPVSRGKTWCIPSSMWRTRTGICWICCTS